MKQSYDECSDEYADLENSQSRSGPLFLSASDDYWQELLTQDHPDGMKFVSSTQYFEYLGKDAYIIIKKRKDRKDVEMGKFDFKLSELMMKDVLRGRYKIANLFYSNIYTNLDIDQVMQKDKANLDYHLKGLSNFTYGEALYEHFMALLHFLKPQPGEIFWDLGCGSAKPVAIAALNFPFS